MAPRPERTLRPSLFQLIKLPALSEVAGHVPRDVALIGGGKVLVSVQAVIDCAGCLDSA
jgi:hypothetical protein